MSTIRPPRDNIVRATFPGAEYRDEGGKPTMAGHFAVFNQWTRIASSFEGTFMERIAPGAFAKAFSESKPKVLFQHGKDPQLGDQVIGSIRSLTEDSQGAAYEVELFDGLPPLVMAGLRENAYGASFRFSVVKEDWNERPSRSASNPDAIPERTIREARVPEFGPVTFPAYLGATAGMRSMTDEFVLDRMTRDPERLAELIASREQALPPEEPATATPEVKEPPPVTPPEAPPPEAAPIEPTDPPDGGSSDSEERTVEYTNREDMASRVTELKDGIVRMSTEYPGELPGEAQERWDADNSEIDTLERNIAAWDARVARVASLQGDAKRTESTYSAPTIIRTKSEADIYDIAAIERSATSIEERGQLFRDAAMRSVDSSTIPLGDQAGAKGHIAQLLDYTDDADKEIARRVLLTGSPVYKRAFNKYLQHGNERAWTPEESRAAALAVTGTTTTGGYAVPYIFDPTFIAIGAHTTVNPYRAACRVETISGGNNWRAVTATAITAKWDTEAAASVEGGPTIGQPTFTVQRADAFVTASIEALQDRPDLSGELGKLFQEAKDNLEENSFTLGVGTTVYPQGMFLSGAFTVKTTATNDVTAILDTVAVEGDLPIRHRTSGKAAWFMSRSTQRQLEALDTGGYYFKRPGQTYALNSAIPQNSPTGNTGTQLLGYPIWEVPSAVSTLTTDASVIAVFGNPENYVVVDRIGMNVEVIQNMLNGATPSFPTGQRGIYAYWRATARALNADGMRQLKVQ